MQMLWMCLLAAGGLGVGASSVQPESAPQTTGSKRQDNVVCSLTPEFTKVKPGTTFSVAVVLQVAPKWHVYWPGQNDAGVPVAISLNLPEGWTAGEVGRPTPQRHIDPGDLLDYVHEGKVVFTVPVTVASSDRVGLTQEINAEIEYLVCKGECVPGKARPKARLEVVSGEPSGPAENAALIKEALQKQPKAKGWEEAFTATMQGTEMVLTAKDAGVTRMTFMPREEASKLLNPIKSGQASGKQLRLSFHSLLTQVAGVVELTSGNTSTSYAFTYRPIEQAEGVRPPADLPRMQPPNPAPEKPGPSVK